MRQGLTWIGWTMVVLGLTACGNGFYRRSLNKQDNTLNAITGTFTIGYVPTYGKPPIVPERSQKVTDSLMERVVTDEARVALAERDFQYAVAAGDLDPSVFARADTSRYDWRYSNGLKPAKYPEGALTVDVFAPSRQWLWRGQPVLAPFTPDRLRYRSDPRAAFHLNTPLKR
jgi:hypothetical protein